MAKVEKNNSSIKPDATDQRIIEELRKDGRKTNSAIAKDLGITEGTVRQRIKNLIQRKVLRISGEVNPEIIEDHQLAFVAINISDSNLLQQKAEAISELPEVLNVSIAAGRYDLFAEVLIQTNHGMIDFLTQSLPTIDGISGTETFLLLKSIDKWI